MKKLPSLIGALFMLACTNRPNNQYINHDSISVDTMQQDDLVVPDVAYNKNRAFYRMFYDTVLTYQRYKIIENRYCKSLVS
jgi:hypothetical protein